MMARILVVAVHMHGMLRASTSLAKRLADAGHELTLASTGDGAKLAAASGLTYHQLPPLSRSLAPALPEYRGVLRLLRLGIIATLQYRKRKRIALQGLNQAQYRDLLTALDPDLIIIDNELHEYIFTTHANGRRYLLVSSWFATLSKTGLPPITKDLAPAQNDSDRRAIATYWKKRKLNQRINTLRRRLRYGGCDRRSILLAYARTCGFPQQKLAKYDWPLPFAYRETHLAHLNFQELEFPYDVPTHHHYVGPMIGAAEPAALEGTLAGSIDAAKRRGQLIIYFTDTTMERGRDVDLLPRVIEAVSRRKEWYLIASSRGDLSGLSTVPENIGLFDWVPQLSLLAKVDACINHAGINTVNECIYRGVPMLIYSGGQYDQPGCTARLRYHGLALVGDRTKDDANRIEKRIETILTEPTYRQRTEELQNKWSAPPYLNGIEDLVDRLLVSSQNR